MQCSVGCGLGYALREVRCMLSGRKLLKEFHCFKIRKPIKMRRCQNRLGCKWKVGPWKQVSVYCFISKLCYCCILYPISNRQQMAIPEKRSISDACTRIIEHTEYETTKQNVQYKNTTMKSTPMVSN